MHTSCEARHYELGTNQEGGGVFVVCVESVGARQRGETKTLRQRENKEARDTQGRVKC